MLAVSDLHFAYGEVSALRGVGLHVASGELVGLLGPNGAGKTTLLRTISGLQRAASGRALFDGLDLSRAPAHAICTAGLVHVPEGRRLFPQMSVLDNLHLGAATPRARPARAGNLDRVFELFPVLARRRAQDAGTLSGGEQQMLAIGRALMAEPRMLMLDEPTLGLSPLLADSIMEVIDQLNQGGLPILVVSQEVVQVLKRCDRAYILENGAIVLEGAGAELLEDERVAESYLGI